MGYYTRYELDIVKGPTVDAAEGKCPTCKRDGYVKKIPIIEALRDSSEAIDYVFGGDTCKWYDHEGDMKAHSAKFPDTVFRLQGWGEEEGDIWVKFFKGGKMQAVKARIEVDDFDEGSLQ